MHVVDSGVGANVLDGPAHALVHLRDVLASQPRFRRSRAGEIVTTGTLTDAWPVRAGRPVDERLRRAAGSWPRADDPLSGFSYRTRGEGEVAISRNGRVVTVLRGRGAAEFLAKVDSATLDERQLLMARVTGNYKRGNERVAAGHRRRTGG